MALRKLLAIVVNGAVLLAAPPKVAFIYNTPVGDAGWSYQHDQGRKEAEAALKGQVTIQTLENVNEAADSTRVIHDLCTSGTKLVFTTSFGFMNATLKAAQDYPDVTFLHCSGYKTAKNVGIYNARFYEGRYLNGVIAGRMTKTHLAGYVAAYPIPEVIMGINAFTQGMRSVDPKAEVRVIWLNSWFDPGKEREAANVLISQGCDMITHHMASPSVAQVCEEKHKDKGVWVFSYHSDMAKYAPTAQLTGTIHVWGDFYIKTIKEVLAGTWKGTNLWGGFKEGMIKLAPLSPAIPADVQKQVAKLQAGITAGTFHPFQGPVVAQDGTLKVAVGKVISDDDLGGMKYLVQGVASSLPKQ